MVYAFKDIYRPIGDGLSSHQKRPDILTNFPGQSFFPQQAGIGNEGNNGDNCPSSEAHSG